MAKLMRCTESHWQGNTFIVAGTVRPEGHPEVIPLYFEAFAVEEPPAVAPEPVAAAPESVLEPEPVRRGPGRPRKAVE